MPQAKQLFFDCDNTLVFSEEVAFETCSGLVNALLTEQGIPDRYSGDQLIVDFLGQTFRGMMVSLQIKYKFQMTPQQVEFYVKAEEVAVIAKLQEKARPCDGVMEVLETLHKEKKYDLAVVSSSALDRVRASLEKVEQTKFFEHERVYSAATSLKTPAAKPNPAVYFHAMEDIGVKPEECITVEDSKSGATAALGAGIPCIAYVGAYSSKEKQNQVARTLVALGCKAVMYHWSEYFDCVKKIEQQP